MRTVRRFENGLTWTETVGSEFGESEPMKQTIINIAVAVLAVFAVILSTVAINREPKAIQQLTPTEYTLFVRLIQDDGTGQTEALPPAAHIVLPAVRPEGDKSEQ